MTYFCTRWSSVKPIVEVVVRLKPDESAALRWTQGKPRIRSYGSHSGDEGRQKRQKEGCFFGPTPSLLPF